MKLIEATAEDLDALVDRWYSLAKSMEAYSELNELSYADVGEVSDDGFRAHLDDEKVTDYLIVHETETIGFLTLREGYHSPREHSHYLRIVNLAIDEDCRNRGHGSEVVELVKEMARDRGCDHLKVSCEWHNEDARRFYHDTDFQPKQIDYAQSLN